MAEAVKNPEIIPFAALGDGAALWNFGMQQFEAGLAAQVEFLGNLQTATETYWRHRRQNLEDAAITLRRMSECKDFGEAAAMQQKWMSNVAQSLLEDFTALSRRAQASSVVPQQRTAAREVKIAKAAS